MVMILRWSRKLFHSLATSSKSNVSVCVFKYLKNIVIYNETFSEWKRHKGESQAIFSDTQSCEIEDNRSIFLLTHLSGKRN